MGRDDTTLDDPGDELARVAYATEPFVAIDDYTRSPWERVSRDDRAWYAAEALAVARHVLERPEYWRARLGMGDVP